jgi:hypothetical protein
MMTETDRKGLRMIDRAVEPKVREIFNAIVVEDEERFQRALSAVPDGQAQSAFDLAMAIDQTIMNDLHDGPPSEERLKYLVDGFYKMEDWYKTDGLPVENFLRALGGLPADKMEANTLGLLAFLVGGWLLTAFLDSGVNWYQYLDGILDRLDLKS